MSGAQTKKARNMMYTQQLSHLPHPEHKDADTFLKFIQNTLQPERTAVIKHDKDTDENGNPAETHMHAMIQFENPRSIANIAKLLNDRQEQLTIWKGRAETGFSYLIHATDNSRTKHQYDVSEVTADFNYKELVENAAKEVDKTHTYKDNTQIKALLDLLYAGEITMTELEKQLTGSMIGKYRSQIENVYAKRLELEALKFRQKMIEQKQSVEVIWIYGAAETGKSFIAKQYAKKRECPYYISGSTRDIFQKYAGEHTVILDELRPESIKYQDLLRLLDPFGEQVMAPARYNDKILACDLIIVTTPYDPHFFYRESLGLNDLNNTRNFPKRAQIDSFEQLLRRLSSIIEMNEYWIHPVEYDSVRHTFNPVEGTSRKNIYSKLNRPTPVTKKNIEIFNNMFEQGVDTK